VRVDETLNGFAEVGRSERSSSIAARVLLSLFALMPPIGIYAALGVAPLLAVIGVLALVSAPRRCWAVARNLWVLVAALVALGLWAALSAVWSILPAHSAFESGRLLTLSATGIAALAGVGALSVAQRARLAQLLALSVIVTVAVFAFDVALGEPMLRFFAGLGDAFIPRERFDRGTTVLVLAFWPTAMTLWSGRRKLLLTGLVVATIVALVMIPSTTNRLGAIAAVLAFVVAVRWPRIVAGTLAAGVVVAGLAFPVVIPLALPTNETVVAIHHEAPWLKHSALHRLLIWRFVSERIGDRPWLGWGMDASRELPGGKDKLIDTLSEPVIVADSMALPLHPHDALLQWRVELGVPGLLLCLAIVVGILWRIARSGTRALIAARLAAAAAGLTIAMLGYGAWQAWWLSSLWLAAALFMPAWPSKLEQPDARAQGTSAFPAN
jgi:O-antigen ligase